MNDKLECYSAAVDKRIQHQVDLQTKPLEWQNHLQEIQEVIPGLYLGPFSAASEKKQLASMIETGITHIVCVSQDLMQPYFPANFQCFIINLDDSLFKNIIPILPQVKQFIDNCFKIGGKVLIHSNWGTSKSAILVIAYIMETKHLSYSEAYLVIQEKKISVNPDDDFLRQLKEYEPIFRAKNTHMNGHTSKEMGQLKRRLEDLHELDGFSHTMDICEDESAHL